MPAAAAAPGGKGWKNIRNGAVLQCAEAITLGMPLEVWKTHMGRYRSEATLEAFWNIHKQGGGGISGVAAFWKGSGPKMVESASKGAVLIYAKEAIAESCTAVGVGEWLPREGASTDAHSALLRYRCRLNWFHCWRGRWRGANDRDGTLHLFSDSCCTPFVKQSSWSDSGLFHLLSRRT